MYGITCDAPGEESRAEDRGPQRHQDGPSLHPPSSGQAGDGRDGSVQETRPKKGKRPKKKTPNNPLQNGVLRFLHEELPSSFFASRPAIKSNDLVSCLPKRFTVYKPLLLLPSNVFSLTPQWTTIYAALDDSQRRRLYSSIAVSFSDHGITHIAMNAPISPTTSEGSENVVRSPSGLLPLLGDFGALPTATAATNLHPTKEDFDSTLWVNTIQNGGITQVWAPLYTMFSRGNIVEKARILGISSHFEGLDNSLADVAVVDMYAGIGYFVFSYLRRGVKRVWAWEINGWSLEGLRRGCRSNGWGVKTMVLDEDGRPSTDLADFVRGLTDNDMVVAFHGSNEFASSIMSQVKELMTDFSSWTPIRHVNLGLLPSSQPSWQSAVSILDRSLGGWVHVHENVDVHEISDMGRKIVDQFSSYLRTRESDHTFDTPKPRCCHVHQVKTYAPGVMHCVFDIQVPSITNQTLAIKR